MCWPGLSEVKVHRGADYSQQAAAQRRGSAAAGHSSAQTHLKASKPAAFVWSLQRYLMQRVEFTKSTTSALHRSRPLLCYLQSSQQRQLLAPSPPFGSRGTSVLGFLLMCFPGSQHNSCIMRSTSMLGHAFTSHVFTKVHTQAFARSNLGPAACSPFSATASPLPPLAAQATRCWIWPSSWLRSQKLWSPATNRPVAAAESECPCYDRAPQSCQVLVCARRSRVQQQALPWQQWQQQGLSASV